MVLNSDTNVFCSCILIVHHQLFVNSNQPNNLVIKC